MPRPEQDVKSLEGRSHFREGRTWCRTTRLMTRGLEKWGHDVGYGETRDGDGRVPWHRPADCGMPVAGYMVSSGRRWSNGTEERVLALMLSPSSSRDKLWRTMLVSLSHAKTGYMVRSMRLIPWSSVKPAKGSDCCGPGGKRVVTRSDDKAEKDAVKLNEERGEVPSVEEGHDAERHVGGVWRAERRCQSWRRAMMRWRLDSGRQGFQRLRARLFERRHAAGEEVPRDAFGHVRVAGTLDIDAVWIPKLIDLDAETAQLHKHGSNDCVHVLSSEGADTDVTAESESLPWGRTRRRTHRGAERRRQWHDVSMMKLAMSSLTSAKRVEPWDWSATHIRSSDMPMSGFSVVRHVALCLLTPSSDTRVKGSVLLTSNF